MTLMGLTRGPNANFEGTATFEGTELVSAPRTQLRKIRGAGIAMVFQDPMSSLDPVYRIGTRSSSRSASTTEVSQGRGHATARSS